MIGNDVIDLQQSRRESNWQRKGFIEKLYTDAEKQLIKDYHDPEIMIWLLWSMKEAAYKIYNRQTKIREYIPKRLACSILSFDKEVLGFVICNGNQYYTKTVITPKNIHTIAVVNPEDLNKIIEIDKRGILKNENGIPYWFVSETNSIKEVSISNHGSFERVVSLNTSLC